LLLASFHRTIRNADFNNFASDARIADHAFPARTLAEIVHLFMK